MTDVSEPIDDGLHYYVLPKDGDPVAALNILRGRRAGTVALRRRTRYEMTWL
jgi:hypothetical protein